MTGRGTILFVQGVCACGKSSLLTETAEEFKRNFSDDMIITTTFRTMIDEYIKSSRIDEFIKKYSKGKLLLLIDDVEYAVGKQSTQEIFAEIFKTIAKFGVDIVLFSEANIEQYDQFLSLFTKETDFRFTEIKKADLVLRKKYLDRVLKETNVCLPAGVLKYILFNKNIELSSIKGCLLKIKLKKSFADDEIDDAEIINSIAEYA